MRSVSLYPVVPLLSLAFRSVPDTLEKNVDIDKRDVPHVRSYDNVVCLTSFVNDFEEPLSRLGA